MVVVLFILGILGGSFGGILMKIGASNLGSINVSKISDVIEILTKVITSPSIVAGLTLYFGSAIMWLFLLTKLDISFVQPILALTYVVTPILAIFILNENVPALRWVGIAIIILGVFIVARTSTT